MKSKSVVMAWLSLGLMGCAASHWVQPGKTEADFNRDRYDCQSEAAQYSRDWGAAGNPLIIADRQIMCLEARGWVRESSS